jgi:hypothetical protein
MDDLHTRFMELDSIEPPPFAASTRPLSGTHEPASRRIAVLLVAALISAASLIALVRAFEPNEPAPAAPGSHSSPFVQLIEEIRASDAQLEPILMSLNEQIHTAIGDENGENASQLVELMQQRHAACRDGTLYPTLRSLHSTYVIDFCSSVMHEPSESFPATLGLQYAPSKPDGCQDFLETAPPSGYCLDGFVATAEESQVLGDVLRGRTVPAGSVDALLNRHPSRTHAPRRR